MNSLLLHKRTKTQLDALVASPPQGILLSGPAGSSKKAIALNLAAKLLQTNPEKIAQHPYFTHIKKPEDKKEISIDTVRSLVANLKLKTPGQKPVERVIFIDEASSLSHQAQNALLKVLEEPNKATVFILSAPSNDSVLNTITSRLQVVKVLSVNLDAAIKHYKDTYKQDEIESNWRLSQGKTGLLNDLLEQGGSHYLKATVEEAKNFLKMSRYERLIKLDSYDQSKLLVFLQALSRILTVLHKSALEKGQTNKAKQLLDSRREIEQAENSLLVNASTRLTSLKLILNLKI